MHRGKDGVTSATPHPAWPGNTGVTPSYDVVSEREGERRQTKHSIFTITKQRIPDQSEVRELTDLANRKSQHSDVTEPVLFPPKCQ